MNLFQKSPCNDVLLYTGQKLNVHNWMQKLSSNHNRQDVSIHLTNISKALSFQKRIQKRVNYFCIKYYLRCLTGSELCLWTINICHYKCSWARPWPWPRTPQTMSLYTKWMFTKRMNTNSKFYFKKSI